MRGMHEWMLQIVARPGTSAVNELWPLSAPRRKVSLQRLGTHTRVILVAEDVATVRPWIWA